MKRFFAFALIFSLMGLGAAGFVWKKHKKGHKLPKEAREMMKIKMMATFVSAFYKKVCSNPEASVILAAIGIKEAGKDGKIDSVKYLRQILPKVKKQSLRNFIYFLIIDAYKNQKKKEDMVEEFLHIMEENLSMLNTLSTKTKEGRRIQKDKKDSKKAK